MSFDLGFLVFLNYTRHADAARSLRDGIELYEHAESIGFDSGWVRVHHGVQTLTSPFPFFAAVAQRTTRIRLATAVIPVGFEHPLRFAEAAATTDLLADGRLELGLSSGIPDGNDPAAKRAITRQRLDEIQAALAGAAEAAEETSNRTGDEHLPGGPVRAHSGDDVALPYAPGLTERLWYGAGSIESALDAARRGLHLVLSTIGSDTGHASLGHQQAEIVAAYRAEFAAHHPGRVSRVAISRSILPIVDADDESAFGGHAAYYASLVDATGHYTDGSGFDGLSTPLYSGEPARIVDELAADPALALADELLLTPISELSTAQKKHVFAAVAEHVAPGLGRRSPVRGR
ncbi:LLM class flavin-dependent oxidoreductase [Gryllotalpicola sp.]|uniref:LLM class flavin-dependent oxidoreductase n=1 Tax=Gryllotalpicola sp. TaxID=1932787 RepID=UPI00260DA24B|nr:LLM class flavin-dependent oxidoreductase [Gryllotalpicola sp.]